MVELEGLIERFCPLSKTVDTRQFIQRRAAEGLLRYLGNRRLDDLTRADIPGLMSELGRGTTPWVAERRFRSLGTFLQMAIDNGLARSNLVREHFRDESGAAFRAGGQLSTSSGVPSEVLDLAREYVRQGKTPGARGVRGGVLEEALKYLGQRALDDLEWADVAAIEALVDPGTTTASLTTRMGSLSSFWELAVERGLASRNPVRDYLAQTRDAERPRHTARALNATQWELVRAPRRYSRRLRDLRDRLLVLLAVHTGASRQALLSLRFGDCQERAGVLTVFLRARGGTPRGLYVANEVRDAYRRYSAACGARVGADTPLFFAIPRGRRSADGLTRFAGRGISPTAATAAVKAWGENAGRKKAGEKKAGEKKAGVAGLSLKRLAATRYTIHFRNEQTNLPRPNRQHRASSAT